MKARYLNIILSIISLLLILFVAVNNFGKKTYTQAYLDKINLEDSVAEALYKDSLEFIRWQFVADSALIILQQDKIKKLDSQLDNLLNKHNATIAKANNKDGFLYGKLDTANGWTFIKSSDTGFVYAPSEYVQECEGCFNLLGKYKNESKQLEFQRDSYDSLMRQQSSIQENRIKEIIKERDKLVMVMAGLSKDILVEKCDTTRKLKFSLMGMAAEPFLPRGGGFGFIYEDKKFNDFAAHVVFTNKGNIYLFNFAKTISFKRKK